VAAEDENSGDENSPEVLLPLIAVVFDAILVFLSLLATTAATATDMASCVSGNGSQESWLTWADWARCCDCWKEYYKNGQIEINTI
jgi:hypothetical protein